MKTTRRSLVAVVIAALISGHAVSADAPPVSVPAAALDAKRAWQWSHSCALCHVTGDGGAPRLGNAEEWEPRLARGRQTLLEHAIEGFNNMPPLGYCMSCERDDLAALIHFMLPPSAPQDAR